MIIVRLWGGIGNQLFQYVFGQYLFYRYGEKVYYDNNVFNGIDKLRKLELDAVDVHIDYDNRCRFSEYRGVKNRLLRMLFDASPYHHFIQEGHQLPQEYKPKHIYFMQGYWQDVKYYRALREFQPDFALSCRTFPKELMDIKSSIAQTPESVSIHIRRGDYFTPQNIKIYGVCDEHYYMKAFGYVHKQYPNATPYIFSDDLNWVHQHLDIGNNVIFVPNYNVSQFAYIELMSLCKHHIISNSSFSWWGAVIGTYDDSMVIAPSQWLLDSDKTIALDEWVKI